MAKTIRSVYLSKSLFALSLSLGCLQVQAANLSHRANAGGAAPSTDPSLHAVPRGAEDFRNAVCDELTWSTVTSIMNEGSSTRAPQNVAANGGSLVDATTFLHIDGPPAKRPGGNRSVDTTLSKFFSQTLCDGECSSETQPSIKISEYSGKKIINVTQKNNEAKFIFNQGPNEITLSEVSPILQGQTNPCQTQVSSR